MYTDYRKENPPKSIMEPLELFANLQILVNYNILSPFPYRPPSSSWPNSPVCLQCRYLSVLAGGCAQQSAPLFTSIGTCLLEQFINSTSISQIHVCTFHLFVSIYMHINVCVVVRPCCVIPFPWQEQRTVEGKMEVGVNSISLVWKLPTSCSSRERVRQRGRGEERRVFICSSARGERRGGSREVRKSEGVCS